MAGHVARLVSTHPVGDDEQAHRRADGAKHRGDVERQQAVLVQRALLPHIGATADDEGDAGRAAEFLQRGLQSHGEGSSIGKPLGRGQGLGEEARHHLRQRNLIRELWLLRCQIEQRRRQAPHVLGEITHRL